MADVRDRDRPQPHQLQVHPQHGRYEGGMKGTLIGDRGGGGPSATKVLAVMASLPVGGSLLALAGFTLLMTVVGLAITTPLFILFSPVLVPAAVVVGLAVTGFLTSGAFGLTALSSLSWVLRYIRQARGTSTLMHDPLDATKRRMQDMAGYAGQKTKEMGQQIQSKAGAQEGRT
ncbi:oleosin 18.2 kDa-like [Punica granatum]|uniref:Uncharacterized protein n=2 Tax=Punica granatum TaxID=22663 RepID=A0A218WG48_PUNGR|nr:oleosin 18.2 kDa-like [Punica granatum]OWM71513.1 hypothetical protein CDL15_Pgr005700 [Punica granatum]PKI79169.1 hypothetical protein CRG98_000461 [Punica granatum]